MTGRRLRSGVALTAAIAASLSLLGAADAYAGVVVSGRSWLRGHGVDACYPSGGRCPGNSPLGDVRSAPWQCVELAQRLYAHLGWYGGIFAGVSSAYQIYGWAPRHGMSPHRNGSGYIPVPGDMIISGPSAAVSAGHVAIVDTVDLAAGAVHAVEQNANPSGRSVYRLHGSRLSRPGPYGNVIGVVHSPRDKLRNWDGHFHNGALYRASGRHARLYVIAGGARIQIPGHRARVHLGYRQARIIAVPRKALRRLATVPRSGTLLRAPALPGLWLIRGGHRYRVTARGHRRVITVPLRALERIPVGSARARINRRR